MLRRVFVFAWLFSALCLAQTSGPAKAAEEQKPKRPPTPREFAQQLLDGVRETAGTADPQVSPFILWRAADAYIALDKTKAAAMLEDAFDRAVAIPPDAMYDPRTTLQVFAATSMTEIDLAKAAEMLTRIHVNFDELSYDRRTPAADRVIRKDLAAKNIDGAIDFIGALAGGGPTPIRASSRSLRRSIATIRGASFCSATPLAHTRRIRDRISRNSSVRCGRICLRRR